MRKIWQPLAGILDSLRKRSVFFEPALLLAVLVVWICLSSFLEISEEVLEGDTHALDTAILMMLRDGGNPQNPLGPPWLEEMVRDISGLGGIAILTMVTLGAGLYLWMLKKPGQALYLLGTIFIGALITNVLKYGYSRPRPDLVPHGSYTFTGSFPSGHSMMAALVYLTVGMLLARAHKSVSLKIYFIATAVIITVAVGISRVYLGVHWPTDVVAGWMGGAVCALAFWIIEWAWQEKPFKTLPWFSKKTSRE